MKHGHPSERKGYRRWHLIIMALCCIIPIAAIVALFYANVDSTYLYFPFILLCPLMHFLLMFARRRPGESHHWEPLHTTFRLYRFWGKNIGSRN